MTQIHRKAAFVEGFPALLGHEYLHKLVHVAAVVGTLT